MLSNEAGIGGSMKLFHPWPSPSALWFLNSTTTLKISSYIYVITLRSLTCISDSLCTPVTNKSKTKLNLFPFCKIKFFYKYLYQWDYNKKMYYKAKCIAIPSLFTMAKNVRCTTNISLLQAKHIARSYFPTPV